MRPGKVGWGPEQSRGIRKLCSALIGQMMISGKNVRKKRRGIGSVFLANHSSVTGIWFESQTWLLSNETSLENECIV